MIVSTQGLGRSFYPKILKNYRVFFVKKIKYFYVLMICGIAKNGKNLI